MGSIPRILRSAAAVLAVTAAGRALAQAGGDDDPAERLEAIAGLLRAAVAEVRETPSVLAGIDPAAAPEETRRIVRILRGAPVDLAFENTPLRDALDTLRRIGGFNLAISAKARAALESERPEVTLSLRKVTIENSLNLIATSVGSYRFTVQYGAVVLVRKEELRPRTSTRIYDLTDLVRKRPDFPAPPLALKEPGETSTK